MPEPLLHCPRCGLLDAPDAEGRCRRCGGGPVPEDSAPPEPAEAAIALHPMDPTKLAVMCLCTVGLYQIFWFYRNWRLRNEFRDRRIWPVARSLFGRFFAYSLFQDVALEAGGRSIPPSWDAGFLALSYFALGAMGRLPDPYWLITFASFLPLLLVQQTINAANARSPHPQPLNERYSALNLVGIVSGALLLGLAIASAFTPA